jgi:hypothetical protein
MNALSSTHKQNKYKYIIFIVVKSINCNVINLMRSQKYYINNSQLSYIVT